MTLRRRALIASGTGLGVILLGIILVITTFVSVSSTQSKLNDLLSPAEQMANSLLLGQTAASGDLSDYVLTGDETPLAGYQSSISTANVMIDNLFELLGDDYPELTALVESSASAQRAWVSADAEPTLEAMADAKQARAARITNKARAWSTFDSMIAATTALQNEIDAQQTQTGNDLAGSARTLGFLLILGGLLLVAGFVSYFIYFQRWVIFPLMDIRKDLQLSTRDPMHTHPIEPVGPPELASLAKDAESLRRQVVSEIDEASAARKGLSQDAPLVAAIRSEMQVNSSLHCPGVAIAGLAATAEGVLAGDYWDYIPLNDTKVALMIADVSGHGPGASVVALRVRAIIRTALSRGLTLTEAVELAAESTKNDDAFVTALLILVDVEANELHWLNAGHPPGIGITHDKELFNLDTTGPLISSLGGEWEVRTHQFSPGDLVLGVTDGFLEGQGAHSAAEETQAIIRILRGLDAPVRQNPAEIVERLVAHIREISPRWHTDDVTVVALSRLG
jgi:serine phosphatase RsbU (regulator of sigma subunit)/CHASE3 domain sensor protein